MQTPTTMHGQQQKLSRTTSYTSSHVAIALSSLHTEAQHALAATEAQAGIVFADPLGIDRRLVMLLEHKVAVIYGAGGPIGGAVARAFAREGARVFLAGRTKAKLEDVADAIRARGGAAETAVVDALDERAVEGYVD